MIPRRTHRIVANALSRQAAVALIGPRQVGKTTLAYEIAERTDAHFYRTQVGAEIDLVLELPGESAPWAIEVKLGLTPSIGRGFYNACEDVEPQRAFIVYSGDDRYPLSTEVEAIGLRAMAELLYERVRGSD